MLLFLKKVVSEKNVPMKSQHPVPLGEGVCEPSAVEITVI